jgi:hypothetical protein
VYTIEREIAVILSTSANPAPERGGACGWVVSLAAHGVRITAITTRGTAGASIDDDPPGLRDDGFELSELTHRGTGACGGLEGALSAVALSLDFKRVTLPPESEQTVARITVAARLPAAGETAQAWIDFVDGCLGSGTPVANTVTWVGASVTPARGACEVAARAQAVDRGDDGARDAGGERDVGHSGSL